MSKNNSPQDELAEALKEAISEMGKAAKAMGASYQEAVEKTYEFGKVLGEAWTKLQKMEAEKRDGQKD